MRVTGAEYEKDKIKFLGGHNWRVTTSPMENSVYHKEYVREDGKCFYEVVMVKSEKIPTYAEIEGVKIFAGIQNVSYSKVEFWSDEDSRSKFYIC